MNEMIRQRAKAIVMNPLATYTLGFLSLILIFSYMYFANSAVRTLTKLESTKESLQNLSVDVSELESRHLAVESGINTASARNLGLVEVNNPAFIIKGPASKQTALSFNPVRY